MANVMGTMESVGNVKFKLKEFLESRGISAYQLGMTSEQRTMMQTVYRLVKKGEGTSRVDLPVLGEILDGLREITSEDIDVSDLLVYTPDSDYLKRKKGTRR